MESYNNLPKEVVDSDGSSSGIYSRILIYGPLSDFYIDLMMARARMLDFEVSGIQGARSARRVAT
ncbi:hypothetical protein [Prosthecodimorpha staleyi]|uniref:Uncharacterized protein n=1 Tax=Prosthecodimorpha staleyi TaxID=2840188 RepID=A0A947GI20_9HYPH|nr:hypothetical protein [Prosthecodimorpha staleyi]MBT9288604.1 hypothetical protein [Prosthecodimorpha staleyi]